MPVAPETLGWLRALAERREKLGLNGRAPFFCWIRPWAAGRCADRRGPVAPRTLQTLIGHLARAAGIDKRVAPHTLRHIYATRLLREGLTIREVQELLGHSDVSTTQVYTHVDLQALKEKVQGQRFIPPEAHLLEVGSGWQNELPPVGTIHTMYLVPTASRVP